MFTTNSKGEKVIAINANYYVPLFSNESILCCDDYQNVAYCFKSNTAQGCAFCEFDESQVCECAVCEK